jgi:hypothetical protein
MQSVMKKIIAVFIALFIVALSVNAQTQPRQTKAKTVKLSTKNKILLAVQSQKAKAAITKSKTQMRREGE